MIRIFIVAITLTAGASALAELDDVPITDRSACMEGPIAQFGRYIGEWHIEDERLGQDGSWAPGDGARWNFVCLGNGVAVQDFWLPPGGNSGTNLRTYDAESDAWEIAWTATLSPGISTITAKRQDDGRIVMHYKDPIPEPRRRITFYPPTDEGWRWTLEFSGDEGETWREVYRIRAMPAG